MSTNSSSSLQAEVSIGGCEGCFSDEQLRCLSKGLAVTFDLSSDSVGRVDLLTASTATQIAEQIIGTIEFTNYIDNQIAGDAFISSVATNLVTSETFTQEFISSFFDNLSIDQIQKFIFAITDNSSDLDLVELGVTLLGAIDFSDLSDDQLDQLVLKLCDNDIDISCLINKVLEDDKFSEEWDKIYDDKEECGVGDFTVDSSNNVQISFSVITDEIGNFQFNANVAGGIRGAITNNDVILNFPSSLPGDTINIHWIKRRC